MVKILDQPKVASLNEVLLDEKQSAEHDGGILESRFVLPSNLRAGGPAVRQLAPQRDEVEESAWGGDRSQLTVGV